MTFYRRPLNQLQTPEPRNVPEKPNNTGKWIQCAVVLLVILLIYRYGYDEPAPTPGSWVTGVPKQELLSDQKSFQYKGYTITPIATFSLRARVLSVEHYSSDREAELSPVDFALGWGSMSDSVILSGIRITQSGRWYYWEYDNKPPISDQYIISHSRNMHILPATQAVADVVEEVRKDNIVKLSGYLVSVSGKDGYTWVSSLSMDEQGPRTCKVFWVESIRIEN